MRISLGADVDFDPISRGFNVSLSAINDYDIMRTSAIGWAVPLTLVRQDWKDFLFMVSRGRDSFYTCVLGFYVRYVGGPD